MTAIPILLETWPRRDVLALFRRFQKPQYAVTSRVEVTNIRIRRADDAAFSSYLACVHAVGAALLDFQRRFARAPGGAVLDGRDIGTVICPEAEVKLFITASSDARAHRRWLEVGGDADQVLAEVQARDARDMGRADAPLRAASDAVVIDTTHMSVENAIAQACALIEARLNA